MFMFIYKTKQKNRNLIKKVSKNDQVKYFLGKKNVKKNYFFHSRSR